MVMSQTLKERQSDLYQGLKTVLAALAPGERVPSVRQLMRRYGVSQVSVEKALRLAAEEVPLVARPGQGTFKGGTPRPGRNTILLLVPDFESQFLGRIRGSFAEVVSAAGFRLAADYYPWQGLPSHWQLAPDVAAVLVWPSGQLGSRFYATVQRCPVPAIVLDVIPYGTKLDAVGTDNEFGGALAADHLLRQGRKRLAMLLAEPEDHPNTQARQRGFLRQARLGEAAAPQLIRSHTASGSSAAVSAFEAMSTLLSAGELAFDGLFVDSASGALGVLKACHRGGLALPDELAVLCFDDPPESAFVQPSLTTIRQDFPAWARAAMRIVAQRLADDRTGPIQVAIPSQLIVRESTGGQFHYLPANSHEQVFA